jgi:glycosyltransferase involved in cell wall biosynthesis
MQSRSIWVDITELFGQFRVASHPTGVSRTVLKLADALAAEPGNIFCAARPLFYHPILRQPLTAENSLLSPLAAFFPQLRKLYAQAGLASTSYSSRAMKGIATSLPRSLRYRLFPADDGVTLFARWARKQRIRLLPASFNDGDCLFVPGSFWLGKYAGHLLAQARLARTPVTAFVHDTLLLSHPEWLPGRHSSQFRRGCEAFLPFCAAIVCNSQHTQQELRRLVALPDSLPIETCRLADRFEDIVPHVPTALSEIQAKRYVLCVSTPIPRKNHALLIEAWRCLEQRDPSTPYLLLVGGGAPDPLRTGSNSKKAHGGRVVWLGGVDDHCLAALYRGAWMTAYPSLGEGYGLPVAEALGHGKVCLAAPSGGIPEISADLIDFIDPLDPESVIAKVRAYLAEPNRLGAREDEIRRRYVSTSWSDTARTVRSILEKTCARVDPLRSNRSLTARADTTQLLES